MLTSMPRGLGDILNRHIAIERILLFGSSTSVVVVVVLQHTADVTRLGYGGKYSKNMPQNMRKIAYMYKLHNRKCRQANRIVRRCECVCVCCMLIVRLNGYEENVKDPLVDEAARYNIMIFELRLDGMEGELGSARSVCRNSG